MGDELAAGPLSRRCWAGSRPKGGKALGRLKEAGLVAFFFYFYFYFFSYLNKATLYEFK